MATISFKIFEKKFKNEVSKKAYLECCKWIAEKIIKNKQIRENVTYKIEKSDSKIPTFIVTVFLNVDEKITKETFCKNCHHLYNTFYQVDKINCGECKMRAYRKSVEDYTNGLIQIYKSMFEEEETNEE